MLSRSFLAGILGGLIGIAGCHVPEKPDENFLGKQATYPSKILFLREGYDPKNPRFKADSSTKTMNSQMADACTQAMRYQKRINSLMNDGSD